MSLPSHTVRLCDGTGAPFGVLRLAPKEPGAVKGDCIFDIEPATETQSKRPEVRWLLKRGYQTKGEHKFRVGGDGVLTVEQAGFRLILDPDDEGAMRTRPPLPVVSAFWDESEA